MIYSKALVEAETNVIHSMRVEAEREGQRTVIVEWTVLEYNETIPDNMFVFEPKEEMNVTIQEGEANEQHEKEATTEMQGSMLSGRIVWAASGKPVHGARITLMGKFKIPSKGPSKAEYLVRAETGRDGCWEISGVPAPAGGIRISIRSWEFEWPAIPDFPNNIRRFEGRQSNSPLDAYWAPIKNYLWYLRCIIRWNF